MNLFLPNFTVIDPRSKHHKQVVNILIKNGEITKIGKSVKPDSKSKIWKIKNGYISPGWMDIGTQVGEPGFEHRETLSSVSQAAARGGYTGIACFPNTSPVLHSKSEIQYIFNNTSEAEITFYPIGALTKNCDGHELTEMIDMHHAGAAAFSDGRNSMQDNGVMLRSLEYAKGVGTVVINRPLEQELSANGQMHEGQVSTSLGMKGIPNIAEEIHVDRDIRLADYAESRLMVHCISTKNSVASVKIAKAQGVDVKASLSYLHLISNEEELLDYDPNYKVLPPLRTEDDREALINGLRNGTVDCIVSNHEPVEPESKNLELAKSEFGAIGLETCFAALRSFLPKTFSLVRLVECLSINPRSILNIDCPIVEKGAMANFTLFDPNREWTFTKESCKSKSKNSPFLGTTFTGKVLAIIHKNKVQRFE